MSEDDVKERARNYVELLRDESLARMPQHQQAEVAVYWQSRAGLFRALARQVILAARAGREEADALSWSVREFAKDLETRANEHQRQEYQRWIGQRYAFLHNLAKRIWKEITREEPPSDGFYVALEAHPNMDYDEADYRGRVRIPIQWQAVMSLEDATKKVRRYIESHGLGSGNWVGKAGQVARYGKPWVRISYNGRIWQGWDWDSKHEVDVSGDLIPAQRIEPVQPTTNQSYKFEVLAHGGWSSNAQRYETEEQARAAGEALFSRWTAVEQYRVVPSTDPPNQSHTSRLLQIPSPTSDDKPRKPPTPQLPPPLPMAAYVKQARTTELSPSADEETVLRYSVQIRGLWGKKRTKDFMTVDLAKRIDPKKPLPLETLLTMMRNKVAELKVKPGAIVTLTEQPWIVSSTGVERTSLLSGRTVHTETVE